MSGTIVFFRLILFVPDVDDGFVLLLRDGDHAAVAGVFGYAVFHAVDIVPGPFNQSII